MKSVLPPELAAKRRRIAKAHNWGVLGLLLAVGILVVLALSILRSLPGDRMEHYVLGGLLAIMLPTEVYGLYRIWKHDCQLCRELDFMCPHCKKPLYEPGSQLLLAGRCPRCKQSIIA